ncbi:hypothetical protein BDV36DRAFT_270693 [Aspergillus pseudocaelatus]|uniref:Uncharacterized protein n=1 Tax=Aspergillus pseudocaelatus TaxID=1825620 RepID=A0ABQ6WBE5_9EURO|nr:hypothetical protein BDV36DRAFT_270693 [Aspergillus pseudocaelatus]
MILVNFPRRSSDQVIPRLLHRGCRKFQKYYLSTSSVVLISPALMLLTTKLYSTITATLWSINNTNHVCIVVTAVMCYLK